MTRGLIGALAIAAAASATATAQAAAVTCPAPPAGSVLIDTVVGELSGASNGSACGISWTTGAKSGTAVCATISTTDRSESGCVRGAIVEVDREFSTGHLEAGVPSAGGGISVDLTVAGAGPAPATEPAVLTLQGAGTTSGEILALGFPAADVSGNGELRRTVGLPAAGGGASPGPVILAGPAATAAGYISRVAVLPAGQPLNFVNGDPLAGHNVHALLRGADGQPVFKSVMADIAGVVPVAGAEKLPAGDYTFICTVHGAMNGVLKVIATTGGKRSQRTRTKRRAKRRS